MGSASPLPHPCRTKVVISRSRPRPRETRSGGLDRLASYGAIPYRWSGYSRSRSTGVTTWMGSWPRSRMSSQPPDHKYGIDRPTSPELTAGMGSRASEIGLTPPERTAALAGPIAPVTPTELIHRSEPAAEPIGQGIPYRWSCGPIPSVTRSHTPGHVSRSPL
jgi:hypothetical protein